MKRVTWVLPLLLLLLCGCGKGDVPAGAEPDSKEGANPEAAHGSDIALTDEAIKIAGIETEEASSMPMQAELSIPGVIANTAQGRAVVTPPVAGKILRILVSPGDRVSAGQAIATLQSADLATASAGVIESQRGVITAQAAVQEAKSEIDLANARLRTARAALARQQEFARTGAFSQPSLHQAQKDLNEAEAELEAAQQDQSTHEAQLERAERLFKQELISKTELEQAKLAALQDRTRQQRASKQVEIAKAAFEREKRIADRGLMNSKEIQAAEAEVRSASLDVQQAKIKHQSALAGVAGAKKGVQAARTAYSAQAGGSRADGGTVTVTAPISGVVTDREATMGQAVERTTEICEIENLQSIWVTANVPEKEIAKATKGATAQVSVKAFPGRIFNGVVQVVGSKLDSKTRTMPVHILVDNRDGALRRDMFATVALGVGHSSSVLAIKRSSVIADGDKNLVYIAKEGGKFEEKLVELGRVKGEYVEVVSGLEQGMKVVIKGAFVLKSEKNKSELKGEE